MNPVDISLYAIADPARCAGRHLPELARQAVENGASLIQYRDKHAPVRELVATAKQIRNAIAPSGVPMIMNDRVDVAMASGADGVHLGQDDMPVAAARCMLGADAIIGLSIKTQEDARNAPIELMDYAFVGGVFATQSKDNPTSIGIEGWKERAQTLRKLKPGLPVGAIAGIDETNIRELFEAGCDGVAVISSIFMADDVAAATRNLAQAIKAQREIKS